MFKFFSTAVVLTLSLGFSAAHAEEEATPKCDNHLQTADLGTLGGYAFAKGLKPEKLKDYIQYLTGEKSLVGGMALADRSSKTNREIARRAIAQKLTQLGYRPEFEAFENGANVVVEIPGDQLAGEVLELGAHFDSIERGADDNGAGVALLVHLAELFKANPPHRTVRLVFFDLEETGGQGSQHHVKQIKNDPRVFVGALVVDSIGFYPEKIQPKILTVEIGREEKRLPLARELFYQIRRLPVDRGVQLSAETERVDGEMSDHGAYWEAELPAVLIARPYDEKFDSPHNHGQYDITQNMNWDYYIAAAKVYAELVGQMARVQFSDSAALTDLPEAVKEDRGFYFEGAGLNLPASLLSTVSGDTKKPELPQKPKEQKPLSIWDQFLGLFGGGDTIN